MPTLDEILNQDLGLGSDQSSEKTASQNTDDIEKLAMEIGLVQDENDSESQEQTTKEASMSMDNLYNEMFPGDADVVGVAQEKVAEQDKTAAIEEAKGALAYDCFEEFVDRHITKIAEELAGGATITTKDQPGAFPQSMDSNEHDADKAIDTTPQVQDEALHDHVPGEVGKMQQKKGPEGEQKHASEEEKMAQEFYGVGHDHLAVEAADALDKMAAEGKKKHEADESKEEETLEEEHKQEAKVAGAFIARGYIDSLMKLGSDRHEDPLHYLYPDLEEKVAAMGPKGQELLQVLKDQAGAGYFRGKKIMNAAKSVASKAHAKGNEKAEEIAARVHQIGRETAEKGKHNIKRNVGLAGLAGGSYALGHHNKK